MSLSVLVSALIFLFTGITGGGGFALVEYWLPESEYKRNRFRVFAVLMFLCVLSGIYVLIRPTVWEFLLFLILTAIVTGGNFRLALHYVNEIECWIQSTS